MRQQSKHIPFEVLVDTARRQLSTRRFLHSLGFCHTAVGLARHWGASVHDAALVGILHDIAKELSPHELKAELHSRNLAVGDEDESFHRVWHGLVAATWAEQDFGISDPSVLEAIRYHATAEAGASLLTRIAFVADMTEPMRDFKGVEHLRELAHSDFDQAFIETLRIKIDHLVANKRPVHPRAMRALNAFGRREKTMIQEEAR